MKTHKICLTAALALGAAATQSCLDFDEPGAEHKANQSTTEAFAKVYFGNADKIDYAAEPVEDSVMATLSSSEFYELAGTAKTGLMSVRGSKEGAFLQEHVYQLQFTLSTDLYAQYSAVPHHDFPYSNIYGFNTYGTQKMFANGPFGSFTAVKSSLVPVLNHPMVDRVPELKALFLLMYDFSAIEVADIYGPIPYADYKANKQDYPFYYDDVETVYNTVEANIDTIVACFKHFAGKPEWYKDAVQEQLYECSGFLAQDRDVTGRTGFDTWIRFANSLKLRMAMRMVKVDPEKARRWAEEAVASGVMQSREDEVGYDPAIIGVSNSLQSIWNSWGDGAMTASMESLLMSLGHPYAKYIFAKNGNDLVDEATGEVTPANTRLCGIPSGIGCGEGQAFGANKYPGYSKFQDMAIVDAPVPLMKYSEVEFLLSEAALRGWGVPGTAQQHYEAGILNANLNTNPYNEFDGVGKYDREMPEYMAREEALPYTYVDPLGKVGPWESVTKIGVKWNEGDDRETKLEKIITQKYIALFPNSFEAWAEMRRTGYPRMFPVLNPQEGDGSLAPGDMIRRIPFWGQEQQDLNDITASGLGSLGGPDQQATRLWWDVDAPNF